MSLRVAIVGARGVGKFHAQWYAKEGCDIVAFVASRPETIPQNESLLKSVVPNFSGRGYSNLSEMLENEKPDIVSVCSPHHLHAEHCLEELKRGVHVLCEKPLVWIGPDRLDEALDRAKEVVNCAKQLRLQFAVNTQYAASVPLLREIWREKGLSEIPCQLTLTMEAKMRERDISGVNLWVDLAPHPLSVLIALFPGAELELDGAAFEEGSDFLSARFAIRWRGHRVTTTVNVRRHEGKLDRSVVWDDFRVDFVPFVGEDGIYRIKLKWREGERVVDDFMQVSIRQFVRSVSGEGTPLCDGETAVRQMEWLVALVRKYLTTK